MRIWDVLRASEPARECYDRFLTEKPYEGVMVMLLRKEGYLRTFLVDADVIPSTVKPKTDAVDTTGLEAGLGGA